MPGSELSIKGKNDRRYGIINIDAPWEYQPWIRAQHLYKGKGRRHVLRDPKYPQRTIHLLSDLEREVYYMLRKYQNVEEVFEQYPLDLQTTTEICERTNITHPRHPKSKELIVMTTDFLVVARIENKQELRAYAVKPSGELRDSRVLEKLKIEQLYWESLKVPWCVIDEQDVQK